MKNTLTRQDDLFNVFKSGTVGLVEDFWNVLDHPNFPFVTLNSTTNGARNFPPYNIIESKSGKVRLEMAVAGYTRDRLKVELKGNVLTIAGVPADVVADDKLRHKGIANAAFLRTFDLKGNVIIESVTLNDGILVVTVAANTPEPEPVTKFEIK